MNRAIQISGWVALAAALLSVCPAFGQYEGLVINEILPNPRNSSGVYLDSNQDGVTNVFDDEFIELLNTSTNSIEVSGLWITDANTNIQRHIFTPRLLEPGGSIVVFGGGTLMNFSNPPAQIASGGGLSLNNNQAESVYLFSSPTTVVDQTSYLITASHDAISIVRNPDGTGAFTNHYQATTNTARFSPGRQVHGQSFLTHQPPVLLDVDDQTAFVGLELEVPIRAYDPADRDPITLTVFGNPTNSTFSSTGGVGTFTFTPTEDQAGQDLQLSFLASDLDGTDTNTVSFQIINPNADEDIWINEIHYNNVGTDSDEGVEIAGTAGSVLSEYSLILYNGLNGNTYNSNALTGTLDDEQCGFGAAWFGYPTDGIQNNTEGIALVKGTNVIQFLSYDGVLTAANGPALGMTSIDIGVKESATTPVGYSLQLEGTGTVYSAFTWTNAQPHSRGTLNSNQTIVCLSPPAIEIQKTVYLGHDGGTSFPGVETVQATNGAALTYLFLVSNTGGMALTNVTITDVALGIAPISMGTLVTGQISTSYVEAVLSGDLRNTAAVSGEDPDGLPVTDQDTAEVVEIIPNINIQKTVYRGHDGGASCPGTDFLYATNSTPVTYCFVVENNGNTNINSITITDDSLGIPSIVVGTLPAGGLFSTSVTAVVSGSLTNIATVVGIDPNTDPVSDQDSATVELISPALLLQKTVYLGHDGGASCPGSESVVGTNGAAITYCFQVSNAGDTTLTNVVLDDALLPGFTATNLGTLATGEVQTVFAEMLLSGDLLNTATVSGYGPDDAPVLDEDSAEVTEISPSLSIQKTVYLGHDSGAGCPGSDSLQATNGAPVTYCFVVENTGDIHLTTVTISDDSLGIPPIGIGTLAAGGIFSTSVEAVVTGSLTNTASVEGLDPNSDPVSAQDSATVDMISSSLLLEKTVYLGHDSGASIPGSEQVSGDSGTAITYCFVLSNTGDSTLTNVTLIDTGLAGFTPQVIGTLNAGESDSLYVESTLLVSFLNTATATAYTAIGSLLEETDSAQVILTVPAVTNWNLEYEVIDLGTLGGASSEARGINDRGEVVGYSIDTNGKKQAFLWNNEQMQGIGFLPGGSNSIANAINNSGEITGWSHVSSANYHAFLMTSNGLQDLGTLGGALSVGLAINNSTEVTGYAYPTSPPPWYEPFWWRTNQMIGIPPWDGNETAEGRGINDEGRIAGFTILDIPAANRAWAMVWHDDNQNGMDDRSANEPDSEMKVLGALGGEWSQANAINNSGQVVGWASITNTSAEPLHAFLITPSNGLWKVPLY